MNFTGLRYLQLCKEEIRIVSEGAAGCVRHGIAMCIPGDSGKGFNVFRYIHVYVYVYIYIHMGVDQNEGIWGSYNRRSTANQSRSQRCQSRESSLVCNTILRRGSSKHCYILQCLETWREPGPTQAGLTIAEQSGINRGFHRHFLKIELIWIVRL